MNHGGLHLPMLQPFSLTKIKRRGCRAALSEPPIVSPAVIDRELLGEEAAIQVCSITAGAFSLICLLSGAHLRSGR